MSLRGVKRRGNLLSSWSKHRPIQRDCFAMLAMTGPLENGKMNGYRIKSGMTKGEINKGSGELLWKQFKLLWLDG